ncbi:predicted protein [Uncinocarpus reesii 1704]|uniref:Uncharacterized protein n=1 Tax=Uncinocarpus reesii (strain UAMH 1704) TaxID=336963 RepID=C4JXU2_UNCRE|nr:uncharacterized protein UREG_07880 [Uncinocarpus reesii 1704]EEP83015.1 predicted protein [Uncinocarpus reesii 1704]
MAVWSDGIFDPAIIVNVLFQSQQETKLAAGALRLSVVCLRTHEKPAREKRTRLSIIRKSGNVWKRDTRFLLFILTVTLLPRSSAPATLTVSRPRSKRLDELHDLDDPATITTPRFSRQRQQHQRQSSLPNPRLEPSRPPSSASVISPDPESAGTALRRRLRLRTRSIATDSQPADTHTATAPAAVRFDEPLHRAQHYFHPSLNRFPIPPRTEGERSTVPASVHPVSESFWPARSNRVSSRTASAILWVLEEALRKPYQFTPIQGEIDASMSELMAEGGVSATTAGNGRSHYNGVHRTAQGPAPPQSNPAQSGLRTPIEIMRRRNDREARKKAEQEAREREQQEIETIKHQQDMEQQKLERLAHEERRKQAAGVAGEAPPSTTRRPDMGMASRPPDVPLPQDPGTADIPPAVHPSSGTHPNPRRAGEAATQESSARARTSMGATHQSRHSQSRAPETAAQAAIQSGFPNTQASKTQASSSQAAQPQARKPFPHAFERWEMLSSHWEGLTSYWIRRLEQNNEDLNKDPLNQQMSRQITDLSAAGANLFHAVVELQRLRASSERKFQRWFFDTRAEQERSQELQAELRRLLEAERQGREEAVATAKQAGVDKAKAEELVREMRRELQISRDEARRAWEELGRREQEERERTASLRNGEPTVVGGVQVVPMIQAYPSRQVSTHRPQTREGPYPGGPGPTSMGGQTPGEPIDQTDQYSYDSQVSTPKAVEQFPDTSRDRPGLHHEPDVAQFGTPRAPTATTTTGAPSSKPTTTQAPTRGFYQHESSALHGQPPSSSAADERSYVPSSEAGASEVSEDYEPRITNHPDFPGRQLSYPRTVSEDSDDYENQDLLEQEARYRQQYPANTTAGESGYQPAPVDYSGSGWGPTWESVTPRHRHPTRLSDVIEEDERSRTSPSRASQASRGLP